MPPAGASTGRPAASASCRVGAPSGSTPTTRTRPPIPGGDAADQPAAADRDEQRVESRRLAPRARSRPCPGRAGSRAGRRRGPAARRCARAKSSLARQRIGVDARRRRPVRRRSRGCASIFAGAETSARRSSRACRAASRHRRPRRRGCRPMPRRPRPPAPGAISRLAKAPRGLNEPVCCRNSSFRTSGAPGFDADAEIAGIDADDRRAPDIGADQPLGRFDARSVDCGAASRAQNWTFPSEGGRAGRPARLLTERSSSERGWPPRNRPRGHRSGRAVDPALYPADAGHPRRCRRFRVSVERRAARSEARIPAAFRLVQAARRVHQPADPPGAAGRRGRGLRRQSRRRGRLCRERLGVPATIFVPRLPRRPSSSASAATAPSWWSAASVMPRRSPPARIRRPQPAPCTIHAYDQPETMLGQGTVGLRDRAGAAGDRHAAGRGRRRRADRRHRRLVSRPRARRRRSSRKARRPCTGARAGRPVDAPAGGIAADSLAPAQVGALMFPIGAALRRARPCW